MFDLVMLVGEGNTSPASGGGCIGGFSVLWARARLGLGLKTWE